MHNECQAPFLHVFVLPKACIRGVRKPSPCNKASLFICMKYQLQCVVAKVELFRIIIMPITIHCATTVSPTIITPLENSHALITAGDTATITCEASGYPTPAIVWSKSTGNLSDRVSVSDSVSIQSGIVNVTSVKVNLTLTNASREDTGLYECSANNNVGSDNRIINVTVQCKLYISA